MRKKPSEEEYNNKKATLTQLMELENRHAIDLYFTDETGFNLTPSVPYGWQPIGVQRRIPSSSTKVTNLFGLLSRSGSLKVYAAKDCIDSDFVISCIDEIALNIRRPTVLVMDNAPWHRSKKVITKQIEWAEKELFIFFLPRYSPKLNLIETLWRKMKYEWLKASDYESAKTLENAIFHIIKNYDDEFCIRISKNSFFSAD